MLKLLKILIAFALIGALLYLGHGFILEKAGRYLYYKDELKPADVIVILSGEKTERVEYGVKLFKEGWARKDKIMNGGGNGRQIISAGYHNTLRSGLWPNMYAIVQIYC
jgi:hypothetical protein